MRVNEVLNGLLDVPVWSTTAEEQRTVLVELARAEARLAGLRLRCGRCRRCGRGVGCVVDGRVGGAGDPTDPSRCTMSK